MTNKLVVIIKSLKVPKIKEILLYEMKFLIPNYSCLQNPWLGVYCPPDPRSVCPQLNLFNPLPEQNSWVCHWMGGCIKLDLKEMGWDGFDWIHLCRVETSGWLSWTQEWTFWFHKMLRNSWPAEAGLCFIKLVLSRQDIC